MSSHLFPIHKKCNFYTPFRGAGQPAMKEILTESELRFLASQGLGADDVFDARGFPQWLWFQRIDEEGKTVALGSRCSRAGHRLRSRRGHCVQCDTKKLAFQARYKANQYVYIAGSLSAQLIKIGTCGDYQQREHQLRAEKYGSAGDWDVIFFIRARNAGAVEHSARAQLSHYIVTRDYWKDGFRQTAIELLQCSFHQAKDALLEAVGDSKLGEPWTSSYSRRYEFTEATRCG